MESNCPWLEVALKEYGIHEIVGSDHNPRILDYHSATLNKFTTDEIPWCSAFVNWVMKEAGYKRTEKALAKSWLEYGEHSDEFEFGSIVVLKRGSDWEGHVGFAIAQRDGRIYVLGGNQSNSVCIVGFDCSGVLSYRRGIEAQKLGS